jgi:hypothetical protein
VTVRSTLSSHSSDSPPESFSNAVSASASSLIGNQRLIAKADFPRVLIPLSAIGRVHPGPARQCDHHRRHAALLSLAAHREDPVDTALRGRDADRSPGSVPDLGGTERSWGTALRRPSWPVTPGAQFRLHPGFRGPDRSGDLEAVCEVVSLTLTPGTYKLRVAPAGQQCGSRRRRRRQPGHHRRVRLLRHGAGSSRRYFRAAATLASCRHASDATRLSRESRRRLGASRVL